MPDTAMKWGNWELIVNQHPPVLRNTRWLDIEIEDNVNSIISWIMRARTAELCELRWRSQSNKVARLGPDTIGLVDAFNSIISHSLTLDGEVTFLLGAYSYAASCRTEDPESKQSESLRHPDRGSRDNYG